MPDSPTTRTLKHLRDEGWLAQVVERWQPQARRRIDLFGIIDIVAIGKGRTLGVQATSGSNIVSRINKIKESDALPILKESGWYLVVYGWRKLKSRPGGKLWHPDIRVIN